MSGFSNARTPQTKGDLLGNDPFLFFRTVLMFQTKDVKTMQIEIWGRVKIKTKDKDEGQAYFW